MADTVTIAGKKVNKWVAYGGIGVVVVGGVLLMRGRGKSSSAGTSAGGTDPVTGLPASMDNQVDPTTGQTYLAEAQQYGSVSAAEAAASGGYGGGGYGASGGGYSGLGYGYPTSSGGSYTGGGYTTNAQWAQAVEAGLTGIGYDPQAVGAAVGKYFLSMPLTADQVTIVQTAVAEYGPPPTGSFAIIKQPTGHGSQNVNVPNVVGETAGQAHNKITAAGLVATADPGQRSTDHVTSTSPKAGSSVVKGSTVLITASAAPPRPRKR